MEHERREVHGSVAYNTVDDRYFERRGLRRYAGFWSLWALGVGVVVSGRFFGWNIGLAVGGFGFGEMAIALAIVAVMYLCLCFSIAEMSAALPYTGGAYSFARTALGPWAGFVTGLAECIEYVLTPAVIVVVIGGYVGAAVNAILGIDVAAPIWWLVFYVIFVGINIAGVEATFRVAVVLTLLALGVLAVFWISAAFHFSWELASSAYDPGQLTRAADGLDGHRPGITIRHLVLPGYRTFTIGGGRNEATRPNYAQGATMGNSYPDIGVLPYPAPLQRQCRWRLGGIRRFLRSVAPWIWDRIWDYCRRRNRRRGAGPGNACRPGGRLPCHHLRL